MGTLRAQLRQVLRRLARAPTFTAVTLVTLAVGIGANTAIFTVLQSVLLKPLPYPRPEELVGVWHAAPAIDLPEMDMGPSNYFVYREESRVFQDIGLYHGDSVSVTGVAEPEQVRALDFTDGVLPILGIAPILGRGFTRDDDVPGNPDTVLVTYGYWQRKLAGDPAAVGRSVTIDGKVHQVIGVLPKSFKFLDYNEIGLVLPLQFDRPKIFLGQFSYEAVARLKPGMTLAEANADVARMLPIVMRSFPPPPGFSLEHFEKANIGPNVRPLMRDVVGDVGKLLWILMASISLVLLIACANVTNLLLVRAESRQQELAIRAALGASRGRLAAELLFESLVIGLLGSVLGLAVAYGALELLVAMAPAGLPRLSEIGIGLPGLLFTLIASLFASLLFGCVPILKYSGIRAGVGLRDGGRTYSEGRERHRVRNALVVFQVGLAFVLLICSGLMIRTFRALAKVNPGFLAPAEVQTFRVTIPEADVKDPVQVLRIEEAIRDKLAAVPGVASVGFANSVPMDQNQWNDPTFAEDRVYAAGELPPLSRFKFISPEVLGTLGIPLVAGRTFTSSETHNRVPLAVVSEGFARKYWQDPSSALGKRIRVSSTDDWREIIGVAGDVHDNGMNQDAPLTVYWPVFVNHFEGDWFQVIRSVVYAVRGPRAGAESFMKEVRQAVWSVDPSLPLANVRTLDYYYDKSLARTSFTLVMLALAGGMALLLGVVGLYGVIAYSVTRRTREIGIRMALGAKETELLRMFVRQGLWLAGAGVVFGWVIAVAATGVLSSILFQVKAVDPFTYGAVSFGLVATAALASYLPSRRAATVNPVEALRSE